ncbi:MAG TPA: TonB-dependent receptor [Vicinamibacterales bacterium]|nr:TonB-dependent receptor [Vicinamibacterales bacterium]
MSFPVKPVRAEVTNLGGKSEARAAGSSRVVVFGQTTWNIQPNRLDGFLRPTASVNRFEDSTSNQIAQGAVWKVEWNAIVRQSFYFEVLGGQFIAGRHERPNGTSPRFEDTNLDVFGGNRDWEITHRDNQILASATYVTDDWAGSHHLKVGGEFRRLTITERWNRGYRDDVLHVTQNSAPREVYLFQTPSTSVGGIQWYGGYLQDSWRVASRTTLNLGLRFDRYRVFLPAQEHPAGQSGDRSWTTQAFPIVSNLIDWNVVAPRVGLSQDLTGAGRTVLKGTYGRYWLPAGTELLFNANPNSRAWWERYSWIDADRDRQWDLGEDVQLLERRGGERIESLDPNLKLAFVHEATARIEREIAPNMSVETGVVWRGERQPFLRQDETRPFSAFTRTVTVTDPGIDGNVGTPDDGPDILVYDLQQAVPLPYYMVRNVPNARSDNVTWEVTARRRFSRRWSLVSGFSHTWTREHASAYFGQAVRANVYPLTPNDLINTGVDGRHEFRVWSARVYGTYEGPWGLRITPFLRHQSGQPYGRTWQVGTSTLNLGALRVLAEPIGTRRMDHVTLFDLRVEKAFSLGPLRRVAAFADVFNLLNANPEQNVNWLSGLRFQQPLAIVPPRIARLGVKLEW